MSLKHQRRQPTADFHGLTNEIFLIICQLVFEQASYKLHGMRRLFPLGRSHPLLWLNRYLHCIARETFYSIMRFHIPIDLRHFDDSIPTNLTQAWALEREQHLVRCVVITLHNHSEPTLWAMSQCAQFLVTAPFFRSATIIDARITKVELRPRVLPATPYVVQLLSPRQRRCQVHGSWMRHFLRDITAAARSGFQHLDETEETQQDTFDITRPSTQNPAFRQTQRAIFEWAASGWLSRTWRIRGPFERKEVYELLVYRQRLGHLHADARKHLDLPRRTVISIDV